MGFQTGSQIRPELGNADYSGFANAANIQAQALANFGQQIGEGIEKYQKNKEITGVTLASIEGTLAANPDLIALGKAEEGSISKHFNKLEEDGTLNKRSALEVKGYLDTIMESRAAQKQAEMDAATLANVQAQTDLRKAQTTAAGQSTPKAISTKKLADAQAFLDENKLVVKDGMLYEKNAGYLGFGGSLTPVPNPDAYLSVEGMPELISQSATGSGTVRMQPQDGWSSRALDATNAANVPTESAVSADALSSVGGIPTASPMPESYNPAMREAGESVGQGLRNVGSFFSNMYSDALPSDAKKYYTPGQGIR